jgi:hypothetical protein
MTFILFLSIGVAIALYDNYRRMSRAPLAPPKPTPFDEPVRR